jgi:hypothetical protein
LMVKQYGPFNGCHNILSFVGERKKVAACFRVFYRELSKILVIHTEHTIDYTRTNTMGKYKSKKEENSKKKNERKQDTVELSSKRCAGGKPTEQTHDREYSICLRTKPVNFGRSEGKTKHSCESFWFSFF